jgi:hypothetical protein
MLQKIKVENPSASELPVLLETPPVPDGKLCFVEFLAQVPRMIEKGDIPL